MSTDRVWKEFIILVCATVILSVLGLTMIGTHASQSKNKKEFGTTEVSTHELHTTNIIASEIIHATSAACIDDTLSEFPVAECVQGDEFVVDEEVELEDDGHDLDIAMEQTEEHDISGSCEQLYSPSEFMVLGEIQWNGWLWTWYSERVLPGGGLDIPGRHNDSGGYVCDENDYICLSSSTLPYGTVLKTPFGKYGKVYDTGCADYIVDVYVSW